MGGDVVALTADWGPCGTTRCPVPGRLCDVAVGRGQEGVTHKAAAHCNRTSPYGPAPPDTNNCIGNTMRSPSSDVPEGETTGRCEAVERLLFVGGGLGSATGMCVRACVCVCVFVVGGGVETEVRRAKRRRRWNLW